MRERVRAFTRAVVRRAWVLLICVAVTTVAAVVVSRVRPMSYTAEAVVIVPAGQGAGGPGQATDAARLAETYAALIPDDDRILGYVTGAVGRGRVDAASRITVANVQNTSLVRITYRGSSPHEALAGVNAVVASIVGRTPISPAIRPNTLTPVHSGTPVKSGSDATIPAGILVGLSLGLALMFALHRADPRADRPEDLETALGCPASRLDRLSPTQIRLLLHRAQTESPPWVRLVPVTGNDLGAAQQAAFDLHQLLRRSAPPASDPIDVSVFAAPTRNGDIELYALGEGPVVLLVKRGTRIRDVTKTTRALAELGLDVRWALLLPGKNPESRRSPGWLTVFPRRDAGLTKVAQR